MFGQFKTGLPTPQHIAHGDRVEYCIISSGLKVLTEGSWLAPFIGPVRTLVPIEKVITRSPRESSIGSRVISGPAPSGADHTD